MKPTITAAFLLRNGAPRYESVDGTRHYYIMLRIADAPSDTHAVTYELDESYYDNKREARQPPDFLEEITSYGDYIVRARIRTKTKTEFSSARLSHALRATHGNTFTAALADIENN